MILGQSRRTKKRNFSLKEKKTLLFDPMDAKRRLVKGAKSRRKTQPPVYCRNHKKVMIELERYDFALVPTIKGLFFLLIVNCPPL